MKIGNKAVQKHGITGKQANVLGCIENGENVSTEEVAERLKLQYPDARNQIMALTELGLLDVFDQKGRTLLYGLTPRGTLVMKEVSANVTELSPRVTALDSVIQTNGSSSRKHMATNLWNDAVGENVSAVCVVFMNLSEFVSLLGNS